MKRSRFSEEQVIAILKEQEAGMATADVCRRHGIICARSKSYWDTARSKIRSDTLASISMTLWS